MEWSGVELVSWLRWASLVLLVVSQGVVSVGHASPFCPPPLRRVFESTDACCFHPTEFAAQSSTTSYGTKQGRIKKVVSGVSFLAAMGQPGVAGGVAGCRFSGHASPFCPPTAQRSDVCLNPQTRAAPTQQNLQRNHQQQATVQSKDQQQSATIRKSPAGYASRGGIFSSRGVVPLGF